MVGLDAFTFPIALHVGIVLVMTLFIATLLGYEVDLPMLVGAPMGFFIALFGYGVAAGVHFVADFSLLWSLAGMVGLLAFAAWLYDEAS